MEERWRRRKRRNKTEVGKALNSEAKNEGEMFRREGFSGGWCVDEDL